MNCGTTRVPKRKRRGLSGMVVANANYFTFSTFSQNSAPYGAFS
jgi:hypothetical protein